MLRTPYRPLLAALTLLTCVAQPAWAGGVGIRDDGSPSGSIFPSDRFTVPTGQQITLRRVKLPKPDCAVQPSDCADIDVINQLDGFSTQPRITIPFSGDIDPASVTSDTVYLRQPGRHAQRLGLRPARGHQPGACGTWRPRRWPSSPTQLLQPSTRATCWW